MPKQETVIIDIQIPNKEVVATIEQATQRLSELKVQEKELRDEYDKGLVTEESYIKQLTMLREEGERNTQTRKAAAKQLKENIEQENILKDSLNGLRKQLKDATRQFDDMSRAEREGAEGQALLQHIQDLTGQLNEAEQASGRFQRMVGNYPSALQGITKYLPLVAGGVAGVTANVKMLGKQLLNLLKNPIVLAIAAVVAALKSLRDAIKRNDDAGTNFQSLIAAFKPILDAFRAVLDTVATALGKVANAVGNVVRWFTSWIPFIREASAAEEDLVRSTDALEDAERKYTVDSAKRNAEISELRANAADKEKYTAQERVAMLNQAADLEKKNLEDNRRIAKEKLRLAKESQKLNNDTSDETKNNIAQLEAAVYQAEQAYNDGMRSIVKATNSAIKEIGDDEKAAIEEQKRRAREAAQRRREMQQVELQERRAAQDAELAIMAEGIDKQLELARVQASRQIEDLKRRLATETNLTKAARAAINEQIILAEAKLQLDLSKIREEAEKKAREKAEADAKAAKDKNAKELAAYEAAEFQRYQNDLNARLLAARDNADATLRLKQEEAQKELQLAQEQQRKLSMLTAQEKAERYASAAEYQLAMEQAAAAVIAAQSKVAETDKAVTDQQKANAQAVKDSQMKVAESFGTILDNMQGLFESLAEEDERYADFANAMAYLNILVSTAVSIANAVQGATAAAAATGVAAPFSMPAFIAEMVAIVTGAIGQATALLVKSKNKPKYAEGGVVHGAGTGTSDSVTARVSNGESIMTAKATRMFYDQLSAMNVAGGGRPFDHAGGGLRFARGGVVSTSTIMSGSQQRQLAEAMREAVADIQPVVSVKEITNVQNKIKTKERIANS